MSDDQLSYEAEAVTEAPVQEEESKPAPETLPAENITNVNAYCMRPAFGEFFPISVIKAVINKVLNDSLKGKIYNTNDAGKWARDISDSVNTKIKDSSTVVRFKHVVQTVIGQQLGEGCHYIARCCWDADSDSHVTDVFSNTSLFCVCTVFGVFQY